MKKLGKWSYTLCFGNGHQPVALLLYAPGAAQSWWNRHCQPWLPLRNGTKTHPHILWDALVLGWWMKSYTMDIQGSKATSVFLDIGLFPQIHCIPLGKSREPQGKCDLLIQITRDSISEGCEAVKENATAQDSLFWGHVGVVLKTAASLDGCKWISPSSVASSWFAESLTPAESSGIPGSTFELSRGIGSDIVPLIDQVRHCLCFTPDSLKWIGIVKLVFLEQVTSITCVCVGMQGWTWIFL